MALISTHYRGDCIAAATALQTSAGVASAAGYHNTAWDEYCIAARFWTAAGVPDAAAMALLNARIERRAADDATRAPNHGRRIGDVVGARS